MANGTTFDKRDTVATKHDTELLRRDMLAMEVRLRHDLTLRMGAMAVATVSILAALRFFG